MECQDQSAQKLVHTSQLYTATVAAAESAHQLLEETLAHIPVGTLQVPFRNPPPSMDTLSMYSFQKKLTPSTSNPLEWPPLCPSTFELRTQCPVPCALSKAVKKSSRRLYSKGWSTSALGPSPCTTSVVD